MNSEHDVNVPLLDVKRVIATAKMAEFERHAYRISGIVSHGLLDRAMAADLLLDAAVSNGLASAHGNEIVQTFTAKGFGSGART